MSAGSNPVEVSFEIRKSHHRLSACIRGAKSIRHARQLVSTHRRTSRYQIRLQMSFRNSFGPSNTGTHSSDDLDKAILD